MSRDDPEYFSNDYRRRVDPRNPSWRLLRAVCFTLTWGRDVIRPTVRARQLDHLHYRSLGREIPLVDVVPLSVGSHLWVTALRDIGCGALVNALLRTAAAVWLTIDAVLCVGVLALVTGQIGSLADTVRAGCSLLTHGFVAIAGR